MSVCLLAKMLHILVLCPVLLIAGVQTLTIDSQLGTSVEDCFDRISIGEQLPSSAIYRNVSELTTRECEQICKQDKQCQVYDYGVGAKGNATCNLSTQSEKEVKEKSLLTRHPDYDVYVRRFQCEQSPPSPIQPLLDDPEDGPNSNDRPQHRPIYRPDVDERPLTDDYLVSSDIDPYNTGSKPSSAYRPDDISQRPVYDIGPSYGDFKPQDISYPGRPKPDPYRPERPQDPYRPERPQDPYRPERPQDPYNPNQSVIPHPQNDIHQKPKPDSNDVLHFDGYGKPIPQNPDRPGPYMPEKPNYSYIIRPNRKPRPEDEYLKPNKPFNDQGYLSGPVGPPYKPSRPENPTYNYNSQYASGYGQNSQNDHSVHVEIYDPPRPYVPIKDRPAQHNYDQGFLGYGTYSSQNSYTQNSHSQNSYAGTITEIGYSQNKPQKPYDQNEDPGYSSKPDVRPIKGSYSDSQGYQRPNDRYKPQGNQNSYGNHNSYGSSHSEQIQSSFGSSYGEVNRPTYDYQKPSYNKPSHSGDKGEYGSSHGYGNQGSYGSQSSYGNQGYKGQNSVQSSYGESESYGQGSYGSQSYGSQHYGSNQYGVQSNYDTSYGGNKGSYGSYGNQASYGSSHGSQSNGYGNRPVFDYETHKPGYGNERPEYGNQRPDYDVPKPGYGVPKPDYDQKPGYGGQKPEYDSPKPGYGNQKPDYDRPKPGYGNDRPDPGYGSQKPDYDRPKPGYGNDRPDPGYGSQKPDYDRPKPGYGNDRPDPGYGSQKPDYDRPKPGYGNDRPDPGYGSQKPDYDRPKPGYENDRPDPGYGSQKPDYDRPKPGYGNDRPDPGYGSQKPGYDRPKPGYGNDRPDPGYGSQKPDYDSPKPGYGNDRPDPGYGSQKPGYDRPKPGYGNDRPDPGYGSQKPDYDRPKPGYGNDRPDPGNGSTKPDSGYGKPGYGGHKPGGNQRPGYGNDKDDTGYGTQNVDNSTFDYRPDVRPVYEYEMDKPTNVPTYISRPGGEVVTSRPVVIGDYERPGYKDPGMSFEACFRRVLAGRRALRSFVRKVVPCERLEDCRRECALEKRFHCESFNYRLDQSFRGKGLCELMTKPIEAFDQNRDFVDDKNYDFYEVDRNSLEPNCPETLRGQGLLHSGFLSSKPDRIDLDRVDQRPNRLDQRPNRFDQRPNEFDSRPNRFDQRPNEFDSRPNRFDQRPNEFDSRPNRFDQRPNRFDQRPNVDQSGWRDRHWPGYRDQVSYGERNQGNRRYEDHFVPYQIGQARTVDTENSWGQYGGNYGGQYYKDRNDYHKSISHWGLASVKPYFDRRNHGFDYHSLGKNLDFGLSSDDFHEVRIDHKSRYGYGSWKRGRWTNSDSNTLDSEYPPHEGREEGDEDHSNAHGAGNECYSRRRPGMSLKSGAIRRSLVAHSVVDCEAACFSEREFRCVSYSYRYSTTRGADNCFLSERPYRGLEMSADSGSDVYAMPQDKGCAATNRPWVESECFWHVRSDTAVSGNAVKATLTVAGLGACEAECIRAQGFFCRGFSFRFDSPAAGDEDIQNCILTSSPATRAASAGSTGHELYARGNFGRGCEPAVYDDTQNGECYLQYDKAAKLTGSSIRGQARVKNEQTCGTACTEAPFRCLSFSFNNNAPPPTDNCLLSDIRLFDLQRGVDYVHSAEDWLFAFDLFNSRCWRKVHGEDQSSELPHPIVPSTGDHFHGSEPSGPPSGPGYLPDPPPEIPYIPSSGPPSGPSGPSGPSEHYKPNPDPGPYSPSSPDKTYPIVPYKPSRPSYRPDPEIYRPGFRPPDSNNPDFKPHEIIIPYKPDYPDPEPIPVYKPVPRPGYRPDPPSYRPDPPSYRPNPPSYRPDPPSYRPEQPSYRPEPPNYRPEPPSYRPEPPSYRPDPPSYRPEQPSYRPEPPSYRPEPPSYRPEPDRPFRPTEIYPKTDSGFRPGYRPDARPGFDRPGYLPGGKPRPQKPVLQGDRENGPIEASWRHYTVSGFPCRTGTTCAQNQVAGHWACEPEGGEIGSWDYCCAPTHRCGYSEGFHKPWCFVGLNEDQWRPCSEKYYPYHHHNTPHPSQGQKEPPKHRPWRDTPNPPRNSPWPVKAVTPPPPDYIPHWDKPPGPYLSVADRKYWDDLYENGPKAYYDKHGNPLPGYSRVPTEGRPYIRYKHNDRPSVPSGQWIPVSDPPPVPGLGAPRYWPVAYLHRGPPPNMTYFRYNETKHNTGRHDTITPPDDRPESRANDDDDQNFDDYKHDGRRSNDGFRSNGHSRGNDDNRGNNYNYRDNSDNSRRKYDNSRSNNDSSRRNNDNYSGNNDNSRSNNDDSRDNSNNSNDNSDDSKGSDDYRGNDNTRNNKNNSRGNNDNPPRNSKRDEETTRDDKKIDDSKSDDIFNTNTDKTTSKSITTETPNEKSNNSDVEIVKTDNFKTKDTIKGIDDKLDDFSKSIEVLNIEDAKGEKISELKTLEAEERQIEAIGRLLASRRGGNIVLEKRSQKELDSQNIALDKDTLDFNFGNRFKTERRGVIKRITKDEIDNDKSLEVSETTFIRPPRILTTTDNIRKAVVNGKVFYDATIREQRDLFPNNTRRGKNLRRAENTPSIISNSNYGRKIVRTRNTNPVRRVKRVYRKRYNPGEVRRRLLERDRSKNNTGSKM